jgi:hypothetical protein
MDVEAAAGAGVNSLQQSPNDNLNSLLQAFVAPELVRNNRR